MKSRALEIAVVIVLLGALCETSQAVESFAATPQENALCSAFVYGGKDKAYMSSLEPDAGWGHTHHWCDCVRFRYRAIRSIGDKIAFSYNTGQALQGCDYVIRAVKPGSRILPKVHVDKGRILKLRGETGAAVQEFQRAIALDPHEINAFSELSLVLEEGGQRTSARETIALGLQQNPDAKLLQKRYLELGGKEPFPEPLARIAPAPAEMPVEATPGDAVELTPPEPVVPVEAQLDAPAEVAGDAAGDGKAAEDASGRSCRFCPPEEIQRRWVESFKTPQEKKPE